jgi:hypothetical protein
MTKTNIHKILTQLRNFEVDPVELLRGEIWKYSDHNTGSPNGDEEYKVYTEDRVLWKILSKFNGVIPAAFYSRIHGGIFGRDFIVKNFAIKEVIKLLSSEAELFEVIK